MTKRKPASPSVPTDPRKVAELSDADDRRRRANEVKVETLDVPDWSALRKPPKVHQCGPRCVESLSTSTAHLPYEDRDRVCSPYFVPLLRGWTRRREKKRNGEIQVCYEAPCGRRFRTGESALARIVEYLQVTGMAERMRLTIDMFTFHVDAEPEKLATGLGPEVSSDISNGDELVPIRAVNNVNDEPLPNFAYMRERTIFQWKGGKMDDANEYGYRDDCSGCDCQDNCVDAAKCKCQQELAAYDGRIRKAVESTIYDGNRECNHKCACRRKRTPAETRTEEHAVDGDSVETCVNRVVQNSLKIPLEVYQTADHGWAVRSRVWLPPGRHVCNYAGPYLSESTAKSCGREDSVYLMDVDYCKENPSKQNGQSKTPSMFVIDSKNVGNVGRFFSHSCESNMLCCSVFTDTHDARLPVLALFTLCVVKPGDPLTFHYGPGYVSVDEETGITMMAKSYPCACDVCAKRKRN